MRKITFEQAQAMDLESARSEMCNRVYEAAILFERFENAGKVHGNGHHMAQSVATFADKLMTNRWIANADGQGTASTPPVSACSVCKSTVDVELYSVGNVGVTQILPLCQSCKPNKKVSVDEQ